MACSSVSAVLVDIVASHGQAPVPPAVRRWPQNGHLATFRCQGLRPDGGGMTLPTHDCSLAEERLTPSVSAGASRVDVHRLTRILESLLFGRAVPQLPDWSYRT